MEKQNGRMDILSRISMSKARLFRFVKQGASLVLDPDGNLPGRGIYLEKSKEALRKAKDKQIFLRRYHVELTEEIILEAEALL